MINGEECSLLSLGDFNLGFYESLPDAEEILPPGGDVVYHTLLLNEEKIGLVGYLPIVVPPATGFVQIAIHPEYQGRGFMACAYNLLAEKYELKTLLATIKRDNATSIRAHQNIGFKMLGQEEMSKMRQQKLLKDNEVRLKKSL